MGVGSSCDGNHNGATIRFNSIAEMSATSVGALKGSHVISAYVTYIVVVVAVAVLNYGRCGCGRCGHSDWSSLWLPPLGFLACEQMVTCLAWAGSFRVKSAVTPLG